MTAGKTIALTRQNFVAKIMSLLFNMLFNLVIAFLPRSKHLLISWLQSPSAVILEPPQNKACHCFHCFPIYYHEVMGPDAMILVLWAANNWFCSCCHVYWGLLLVLLIGHIHCWLAGLPNGCSFTLMPISLIGQIKNGGQMRKVTQSN